MIEKVLVHIGHLEPIYVAKLRKTEELRTYIVAQSRIHVGCFSSIWKHKKTM